MNVLNHPRRMGSFQLPSFLERPLESLRRATMGSRIFLALDALDLRNRKDVKLLQDLAPHTAGVKIHIHWHEFGPKIVAQLMYKLGFRRVWVDLKLHDTPSTAGHIAKIVAKSGATHLTVHAGGGVEMMQAAKESGLTVIGVTILTSHPNRRIWTRRKVLELGRDAKKAGLDGIVCSVEELNLFDTRQPHPDTRDGGEFAYLQLYVPGIRNPDEALHDQKRVGTAAQAMSLGADYLVIGRPITESKNPQETLFQLNQSVIGVIEGS